MPFSSKSSTPSWKATGQSLLLWRSLNQKLTLEFSHQGAVHLQESRQRKGGEREGKKRRQHLPDWRLATEIGELLVSVVEDVALLLKSHGDWVFMRIALKEERQSRVPYFPRGRTYRVSQTRGPHHGSEHIPPGTSRACGRARRMTL